MLPCGGSLSILICFSMLLSTVPSHAEEEIEDLIDIAESKSKMVAIVEGRKAVPFRLRTNEKVIWSGSSGYLGAFLTNLRFAAISTSFSAWQALPLRLDESENGVASLSPYMALLVTGDRAIGFHATSNGFVETQLPIHDELLAAEVGKYVAVVVTSSRAFGLAAGTSAFSEISLRIGETMEAIKTTSSKATVRTPDRVLTFTAKGSIWHELRLY